MPSLRSLLLLLILASSTGALSPWDRLLSEVVAPRFFSWFTSSDGVADLHQKHVSSSSVQHMIKGSPLASAPDAAKIDFARSRAGKAVAQFMMAEQRNIGAWKVDRIVEAAGPEFDAEAERRQLLRRVVSNRVVVFSFVDCPWCLLAKERLTAVTQSGLLDAGELAVTELEDLGPSGKRLRAAIALTTGRTSMPSVWIDGQCIGGYTDGEMPSGEPELCLEGARGLEVLENSGQLEALLTKLR
mmetsp:Transcript_38994/g.64759  ORF Transcript_38994/g.64759 Transcript_38994/m.64759 type:complete len:243 (+) Transcript_38994:164-892(+)